MKHLPLLFARRYLRSARSLSVINTTATVSSVAIGVAVAAMVILMSVYNGFDGLLQQISNTSEPDLVVLPTRGKSFEAEALNIAALTEVEGVVAASPYVEESVMAEYRGRQMVATLRGVGDNYTEAVPLTTPGVMWYGEWKLSHGDFRRAVVGRDIDNIFGDGYSAKNASAHDMLTLHALRRENISPLVPMSAIKSARIRHAGTLGDGTSSLGGYIFTSLDWAQKLLSLDGRLSGVVVDAEEGVKLSRVKRELEAVVGNNFSVKTRYELNEAVYKATRAEKWAIFFILLLVTIIAAATIVGSLVMLVGEKQNDIATLYSVGAHRSFVARVFTLAGLFIGGRGVVGGIVGGVAICLVQICFGVVKMPGSTFLIENYPVEIAAGDIIGIVVAVMAVTWLLTNFTISRMVPRVNKPNEARI